MASRSVVIGPAVYEPGSGIVSHEEIGTSARMYGNVLAGDKQWGRDRVTVLPEDQVRSINNVMDAVQDAADQAKRGDTLLVIYIGHGAYWSDVPGERVHFSVGSSHRGKPHTWLSSWYVYHAMRGSRASLKVLIADCCYSNLLPNLGAGEGALHGAITETRGGTCVLTALNDTADQASAAGCHLLPAEFRKCTPFSGHLLNILSNGTRVHDDMLTLGLIWDTTRRDMDDCDTHHELPQMIIRGNPEGFPIFSNRMASSDRGDSPPIPESPEEWVRAIIGGRNELDPLFRDPSKTGKVVALLSEEPDRASKSIALSVNRRANELFQQQPKLFARYWSEAKRPRTA